MQYGRVAGKPCPKVCTRTREACPERSLELTRIQNGRFTDLKRGIFVATHTFRISLGTVELSKLTTEADFRREAQRLLPDVLVQVGEATGEVAWNELQKGFKGIPGFKANSSSSEKRKFIREAGQNFRRQASSQERREIETEIVQQLRDQKEQRH
jgi:hypothetical protein